MIHRPFTLILIVGWIYSWPLGCSTDGDPTENDLSDEAVAYLSQHGEQLTLGWELQPQNLSSLSAFLPDKRVFMLGEYHGSVYNYQAFFALLKSTLQHSGAVQILAETGYGNGLVINRYLATGDDTYLTYLFNANLGSSAANLQYLELIRRLRLLNQNLPADGQIRVWGIDVNHQTDIAAYAMSLLLPEDTAEPPPALIGQLVEIVAQLIERQFDWRINPPEHDGELSSLYHALKSDLQSDDQSYRVFLGDNFTEFELILDAALAALDWQSGGADKVSRREEAMFDHFLRLADNLPSTAKLLGLWGQSHIHQVSDQMTTIAHMLQNRFNSPVKGAVISIATYYLESKIMNNTTGAPVALDGMFESQLEPFVLGEATLFSLDEEYSPFRVEGHLIPDDIAIEARPTTDYFNLMLILDHSPACEQWHAP